MKNIVFNNVETTNLGFGCSFLTRNKSVNEALLNLNIAYDSGIRHFDVARLYGFGNAEDILGKFAKGKRQNMTISTKTGLDSINLPLFLLPVINGFRDKIKRNIHNSKDLTNNSSSGHFTVNSIQRNLEISLKKLKTDYIDFYLLHEADVYQANNPRIIDVLEKEKSKGKILNFGIASNINRIKNDIHDLDFRHQILQHNISLQGNEIQDLPIYGQKRLRIVYNIFNQLNYVTSNNQHLQYGYTDPVEYLLANVKKNNINGVALFSSANNDNIRDTVLKWNSIS